MKTLFKTYDRKQARDRQKRFEAETGLKWDTYHIGDGFKFTPVITRDTVADPKAAKELLPHLDNFGRGFVMLAERSGMPLASVIAGAKGLVQEGKATGIVNRFGNFAGLQRRI